jgi:DNA mismatch repair protein MutL
MPEIRRLPPEVVTKIAAGEVIERPGSVVKELLENAVDANARRIDLALVAGGIEMVRVVDDGCGIPADQLELAVGNHCTSKIRTAEDLFRIRSLGFRGEALAAIASVSHLLIRSRPPECVAGAEILVIGGKTEWLRPCGCPPGTTVEVRHLFFNTPVRRRFLRGVQTELAHATEAFTRIALGHPELHFTLSHNDRTVFELPPTSSPVERIASLFGRELAERLLPVEHCEGPVRLWGYVAHPQDSRTTNRFQYLFINRRYFRDRSLQHALGEAYRGLLPVGRYPVAFLWLEMPPEWVDVNVHPTKLEVRFQDSSRLYGQLLAMLRSRFLSPDITAQYPPGKMLEVSSAGAAGEAAHREDAVRRRVVAWAQGKLASWLPPQPALGPVPGPASPETAPPAAAAPAIPVSTSCVTPVGSAETTGPQASLRGPKFRGEDEFSKGSYPKSAAGTSAELGSPEDFARAPQFPKAIQVLNTYLITEAPEGILLIDQHALHEKILTTQLLEHLGHGKIPSQGLAIPEPVDLRPEEAAILLEHREVLATLGLEVEPFGGGTVLVHAYPAPLRLGQFGELLREVATTLMEKGKVPDRPKLLEQLAATLACKAAIKAGDPLTAEEIAALLAQRHLVRDGLYCPHGRPAVMVLSRRELDRYFHRS